MPYAIVRRKYTPINEYLIALLFYIERMGDIMKHSILLVEDDRSISEMVEAYLTLEGFQVVLAADGEEALQLFHQDRYDLILLDVMLPKLNGIDFLKKIRE